MGLTTKTMKILLLTLLVLVTNLIGTLGLISDETIEDETELSIDSSSKTPPVLIGFSKYDKDHNCSIVVTYDYGSEQSYTPLSPKGTIAEGGWNKLEKKIKQWDSTDSIILYNKAAYDDPTAGLWWCERWNTKDKGGVPNKTWEDWKAVKLDEKGNLLIEKIE